MLVEPLPQSRIASLVEAVTNVAAGFVLAIGVQRCIYPLFGIDTDLIQDGAIALIYVTEIETKPVTQVNRIILTAPNWERTKQERDLAVARAEERVAADAAFVRTIAHDGDR